jgi:hypothetical protein
VNRVCDYCGFAMRFVGVGYIALLPLATPAPVATAACHTPLPQDYLCYLPHMFRLPLGLHVLGVICAGGLGIYLVVRRLSRWQRDRAQRASTLAARMPASLTRPSRRTPMRTVKPRSHFGMRGGVPH